MASVDSRTASRDVTLLRRVAGQADRRGLVGMNWVRANLRLGARLALIALAIQFAAAFGHFDAVATSHQQVVAAAVSDTSAPDHHDGAADLCAICAVVAMANAMLDASPPALPLRASDALRHHLAAFAAIEAAPQPGGFQPRAPPLS
ncbi:hypothetical protein LPW26_22065 [Rhodopseudomonas sp. HC1]|uniref:hypothetical protein n=1 Tax=Rhodopseudomonas infernalis TaxID=2897386 RepID=UPI001EE99D92|nr:hypothetical protein [Rhodopseudomonas infernalis]MCG6207341.1 hypothetical protein [Rhodopseudomonas infernalis]